jgi:hypothetical protein
MKTWKELNVIGGGHGRRTFALTVLVMFLASGLSQPETAVAEHSGVFGVDQLWGPLPGTGYLEYAIDPTSTRLGEEWTGWVDVRHPDGFSPNSAASPYNRSNRQTDIKTVIVSDNANPDVAAAPSTSRDFDHAKKIYGMAGLSILHETTGGGVNGSDTLSMDGTGESVDIGAWGTGINQGAEDDNMKGFKHSGNATTINTYYVKDYDPNVNGLTSGPSGFGGNVPRNDGSGLSTDTYVSNTAAHEWGHMLLNGTAVQVEHATPAESADRTNVMYRTGGFAAATLNKVGILGLHDIVTSAQVEKMFLNGGDNLPHNNPGFVQKPAGGAHAADLDKYGNVVDWNFVVDHKKVTIMHTSTDSGAQVSVTTGTEDEDNGLDAHKGVDSLFWNIPAGVISGGSQTGHNHTGLGTFTELAPTDVFAGGEFRFVDVFSQALRYSDYDRAGANESIKEKALDNEVTFRKADGSTAAGVAAVTFEPDWTKTSNADDFVTRWVSPFEATGVRVTAKTTDKHDGTAQIDAVIAAADIEHVTVHGVAVF